MEEQTPVSREGCHWLHWPLHWQYNLPVPGLEERTDCKGSRHSSARGPNRYWRHHRSSVQPSSTSRSGLPEGLLWWRNEPNPLRSRWRHKRLLRSQHSGEPHLSAAGGEVYEGSWDRTQPACSCEERGVLLLHWWAHKDHSQVHHNNKGRRQIHWADGFTVGTPILPVHHRGEAKRSCTAVQIWINYNWTLHGASTEDNSAENILNNSWTNNRKIRVSKLKDNNYDNNNNWNSIPRN